MIETYCWADTYATQFYKTGGQSRFLEARFLHACDTIAKVIRKRMFPVIEKQVERVDRAVIQICNDKATIVNTIIEDPRTSVEKASDDIRQFALRQLEEAGDIDVAHRLATVWKMEYVYDEEVLKAALAARREKYLQWEELFPAICVPELLATPAALIKAFSNFRQTEAVLGFDVEWGDEHQGAIQRQSFCGYSCLVEARRGCQCTRADRRQALCVFKFYRSWFWLPTRFVEAPIKSLCP